MDNTSLRVGTRWCMRQSLGCCAPLASCRKHRVKANRQNEVHGDAMFFVSNSLSSSQVEQSRIRPLLPLHCFKGSTPTTGRPQCQTDLRWGRSYFRLQQAGKTGLWTIKRGAGHQRRHLRVYWLKTRASIGAPHLGIKTNNGKSG